MCLGLIEHGLADSSHYQCKSSISETPESLDQANEFSSETDSKTDVHAPVGESSVFDQSASHSLVAGQSQSYVSAQHCPQSQPLSHTPDSSESEWEMLDPNVLETGEVSEGSLKPPVKESGEPITVQPKSAAEQGLIQGLVSGLEEDQYGLPLAIFTKVHRHSLRVAWTG